MIDLDYAPHVGKKDFQAMLTALEPGLQSTSARSLRYPHLRYLALIGDVPGGSAFSSWSGFLNHAESISPAFALRTADTVKPTDIGATLFSRDQRQHRKASLIRSRALQSTCGDGGGCLLSATTCVVGLQTDSSGPAILLTHWGRLLQRADACCCNPFSILKKRST
jgi:hypothetical protein